MLYLGPGNRRRITSRNGGPALALVCACLIVAMAGTPAAAGKPAARAAAATLYEQAKACSVEVLQRPSPGHGLVCRP